MSYAVILAGLVSLAAHIPSPVAGLQGGLDSLNMSQVAFYGGFGEIRSIALDSARGYLFGARNAVVDVYDLAQPDNPSRVTEIRFPDNVGQLAYRETDQTLFVGGVNHLIVLDLSSPAQPQIVGSVALPGNVLDLSLSGNLVLAALGDSGLAVVDAQNPAQPALQGRLLLPFPSSADYVATLGNYAYVSDGSANIYVVDFSTPASPTLVGPITLWGVKDLEVVGNVLVTTSSDSITPGLYLHDLSNPQTPVLLGMYGDGSLMSALAVAGGTVYAYAYAVDQNFRPILKAVDITTPSNPTLLGSLNLMSELSNLRVYMWVYSGAWGVRLYGSWWEDGVHIVDVGDPANMSEIAIFGDDRVNMPVAADGAGQRLYIAGYLGNLGVIDLTDPTYPVPMGVASGALYTWVDAVSSSEVYTVGQPPSSPHQLYVYDFSNPAQPQQRATLATSAKRFVRVGTRLYGWWWRDSLEVLDVSNPSQPAVIGRSGLSGIVYKVFPFHGDTLLVVLDTAGSRLKLVDTRQPNAAQEIALITTSPPTSTFRDAQALGDTVLVVRDSTLEVWDVSNTASSTLLGSITFRWAELFAVRSVSYQGSQFAVVAMHMGNVVSGRWAIQLVDITDPAQMQVVAFYDAIGFVPQWLDPVVDGQGNLQILVVTTGDYRVFSVASTVVKEDRVGGGSAGIRPWVVQGAMVFPEGVRGKLTIRDPLGREVLNRRVRGGLAVPLQPGVYFWRLEGDRRVRQGRVVVLP